MSDTRPIITAYCLDWHIHTSSAFYELLIKPLAPYADIRLTAWDGVQDLPAPRPDETTIFCQLPPTENWLRQYSSPVIWIPMADAMGSPANIAQHPAVRVVAFSEAVYKEAHRLGLPAFRITYFPNPDHFLPADHTGERVLLYWNRTGLFNKRFLLKLCRELRVNRVIFRDIVDPRIHPRYHYRLPANMGEMVIENYSTLTDYADYVALLRRATIFIAPRTREGVGIAFLEAMASGCAVLGYDDVTMNEYIQHGHNGYLFFVVKKTRLFGVLNSLYYRLFVMTYRRWVWRTQNREAQYVRLTTFQDWDAIRRLDLSALGMNARQSMTDGYATWQAMIPAYADFVLRGVSVP